MQQLKHLLSALLLMTTLCAQAQVGIGTATPAATAQLDVSSITKGLLPPQMTGAQRNAIVNPATGLMLYCTNCGTNGEPEIFNGTAWVNMLGSAAAGQTPTVAATTAATSITGTTATSGGNITSDGGSVITARGVCWSTIQNPTIADSKTTDAGTTGTYTSNLTGLSVGTTYYLRAYATNANGTAYGAQINFTTLTPPTVAATTVATNITSSTATSGGNITSDGGSVISARGVCWSTIQNPTTANSITNNGTTTGTYTSNLTGLAAGTIYYVRAYATNAIGTDYGPQISFTTLSTPPTVAATTAATSITGTTATSGGNITSDGGSVITARGVCWSTSSTPTIADSKTMDGSSTGTYISSLTGLTTGTTYYVRAYATNAVGTAYGTQISFTTLLPPTVAATTTATSITGTTATSGGNITSDGGSVITARGVCWSTIQNPTIADSKTTDAGTTGSYTSNLTGLSVGTTYYVRAYATNAGGTAYGVQITFTTLLAIGDNYFGGKLAYILQPGDPGYDANNLHGLIAAATDQSTGIRWYNGSYTVTGATGITIGTGLSNTNTITASQGGTSTSYAAGLARAYTGGGYTDWYLPSKDELNKLYLNKVAIGGFTNLNYWSSTENGSNGAWFQVFSVGLQINGDKPNTFYVRAVRAF